MHGILNLLFGNWRRIGFTTLAIVIISSMAWPKLTAHLLENIFNVFAYATAPLVGPVLGIVIAFLGIRVLLNKGLGFGKKKKGGGDHH